MSSLIPCRLFSCKSTASNAACRRSAGSVKCIADAICEAVLPPAPAYVIASATEMLYGEKKMFDDESAPTCAR